jgi:hypothetical protein
MIYDDSHAMVGFVQRGCSSLEVVGTAPVGSALHPENTADFLLKVDGPATDLSQTYENRSGASTLVLSNRAGSIVHTYNNKEWNFSGFVNILCNAVAAANSNEAQAQSAPQQVPASNGRAEWHWVRAGNNAITGWNVATGNADVVINGGAITATLFGNSSDKNVVITLKGSMTGDKLTVRETVHNSDNSGSTYSGVRTVKRWPEFSGTTGIETITLSDGLGMIGISRSLKK